MLKAMARLLRVAGFAVLLAVVSWAVPTHASVSFTVLLDALISESSAAAVVTPVSASSLWEDGRIATYTKVHVARVVAGTPTADVWVKTLGGVVGDIGQQVEGEAVLLVGQQSLVFLTVDARWELRRDRARPGSQFPVVKGASGALHLK